MLQITKSALASCLAGAKSAYPNEFIGLLEGEKEKKEGEIILTITKITIPSGISVTGSSAVFMDWMMPITPNIWGTFHSHPGSSVPKPSRADLRLFSKDGGVHFIAAEPFRVENLAAFDSRGRKLPFTII